LCAPKFDSDHYDFKVVENSLIILQPILVSDCDHGINGDIFLSTNNTNFDFKSNRVYRSGTMAIQMMQPYDFEKLNKSDDDIMERRVDFEIYAKGSDLSVNKFLTKATVTLYVQNMNEFAPRFILPKPTSSNSNSGGNNMVFSYKVPENEDFTLQLQAVDGDEGSDGVIVYETRFVHEEDSLQLCSL
jgi:hypothetical protein